MFLSTTPSEPDAVAPVVGGASTDASCELDTLWETCRNSLAIARLLAHEGRSDVYVATVSRLAEESASRAALSQAGLRPEGDVVDALQRLAAPAELLSRPREVRAGLERVAAAERLVAWVATYLRDEAPQRAWSF